MEDFGQVLGSPDSYRGRSASAVWLGTSEQPGSPPETPQDHLGKQPTPAAQVLIVEDELLAAWHVETVVQDLGHVVCGIAACGEEAVQAAAKLAPDIVFMDVNLGSGIDGVEAARRIRSVTAIPVVFITAYSDATTLQRISTAVPDAPILTKPVSPEAVRMVISARLKTARN